MSGGREAVVAVLLVLLLLLLLLLTHATGISGRPATFCAGDLSIGGRV
jgi:hypothetical protein